MFTGIVDAIGTVRGIEKRGRDRRVLVEAPAAFLKPAKLGDSISCGGVCLTVTTKQGGRFTADVSVETLDATTAGRWAAGTRLNLEPALLPTRPLGGHLVSGHVDGVGRLVSRKADARSVRMDFALPRQLARYVAKKGSICVDGVSLTVNAVSEKRAAPGFGVNIIPHTLRHTTLGLLIPGDPVNLEVDLLARYLERLLKK